MFALNPTRPMHKTLRVLSALLGYPDPRMRSHLREMREIIHGESVLSRPRMAEIDALLKSLEGADPLQAEAGYVELFDRGRGTSLHLFEHVHGDSRERGPAMIDLGQTYAKAGLVLAEGELPDYLPAVLEFASTQPPREARAFLGEMAHILNAIFGALQRRGSAYAGGHALGGGQSGGGVGGHAGRRGGLYTAGRGAYASGRSSVYASGSGSGKSAN